MADLPFDAQERLALCDLFEELGAGVPTLLEYFMLRCPLSERSTWALLALKSSPISARVLSVRGSAV
jgi:hypothetical protein